MGKMQLIIAAAVAVVCFVAGWSLKPKAEGHARAARENVVAAAPAPDPETERLKQALADKDAKVQELEEKLRAATVRREAGGSGGPEVPLEETPQGPRFAFPEYEKVFAEINWDEVGGSMSNLAPLLAELLDSLEKTGKLPPNVGEVQRWNGPLVTVALKLAEAGVTGTGANGSFTHPAVDVNIIDAMLKAGKKPLTTEQESRLDEIGHRFAAEEAQRLAAYPEGTLAIRKLAEEAAQKDRFYAEVDGMLSAEQRDFVHPESVRGYTQLDLFSSGIITYMSALPVDFKDREETVKKVTDQHLEKLGLDAASRPVVEQLVRRWADRIAEAGLDTPREKSIAMLPRLTRAERVRKAALLQADLWEEIVRRVPMTDEQKKGLAAETNILVPFR